MMKDQINRFARGVFEYEPPRLEVTENTIHTVVDRNKEFCGTLNIYEAMGKSLKGIVYSDNDKVILRESAFAGNRAVIQYTVNCAGALNGDIIEGAFHIVSNGGEKDVDFSFRVEAGSYETSLGTVRNLYHFANLAQVNPEEAINLMEADDFKDVYLGDDMSLRCAYEGIMKGKDPRNNLEELLIALRKKARVSINIEVNNKVFDCVEENFKDTILIEKDCWGYANVAVSCNSPFIKLERREISSDAFSGSKYDFSYIIEYDKLHKGKNFAVIYFETVTKKIPFYITAVKGQASPLSKDRRMIQKLSGDLMALYVKFRTHMLNMSEWIRESMIILEAIRSIDDSNPFYRLVLAQIFIAEKKDDLAKELIENVKDEIENDDIDKLPLFCYFMYINTLYNKDRMYSRKASHIVKECYERNEDWRILWTLLFMDEELEQNPSLKLLRIKEQFNKGCNSPALYIEACNILNDQPMLLRVLNTFEINVLYFGIRYGVLNKRLCNHVAEMVMGVRFGSDKYIKLMKAIYEYHEDTLILEGLCKILIRNNFVGAKYLPYYELGINKDLKITQLFEYYIESRDINDMTPLPKMVLMYFGYNNNLEFGRKAYLFANIIHNKMDNPQVYKSYIPQMRNFAMEQLLLGHINEHLSVVYNTVFDESMVTEENAGPVSEVFFTYKVECTSNKFRKVVVRHKESNSEKEYVIHDKVAYVRLYTEDATLLFINDVGNRFSIPYKLVRFMDDDAVMKKCLDMDNSLIHLKLNECEKTLRYHKKNMASINNIISLATTSEISPYYRRELNSVVIDYFYDSYDMEGFADFIRNIDFRNINPKDMTKLVEIYILQGEYEEAFSLIEKHSYMHISPKRLMKLCSRLVTTGRYNDSSVFKSMCIFVFSKGRYDEPVLKFLVDNFNGTSEEMLLVWKRAKEFDIDTYDLEERILVQMMFSHSYLEDMSAVFENYFRKGPKERVIEAYLSYNCYLYFVKDVEIAEGIFNIIEAYLENEKTLPLVCKMALTRYYSALQSLSEYQKNLGEEMVAELTRKDYVFPYFLRLAKKFKVPFEITDKTMVQYRGNPRKRIVIHYVYEDKEHKKKYIAEDMKNVYEGIFVKQFVLFYGENIQYYVTEEDDTKDEATETRTLGNQSIKLDKSEGRYELLNDIIASRYMHDNETFSKLVHTYAVTEYVTGQIFKPL